MDDKDKTVAKDVLASSTDNPDLEVNNTKAVAETFAQEESDNERWYAASDGSYFQERRDPFFLFNLICYCVTMAVFLYFTVVITQDFIAQQRNPPTSTKIEREVTQRFPGIVMCNLDRSAPLEIVFAGFHNDTDDAAPFVNVTNQVETVECSEDDPNPSSCLVLDGVFPAFQYEDEGSKACTGTNSIVVMVNINSQNYANNSIFLGINGFLHKPDGSERVVNAVCSAISPRCQTLAPSFESCPADISSLSFDPFSASSNIGTFLSLAKSETQHTPNCDQNLIKWNPVDSVMAFNTAALAVSFGSIEVSDSLVAVHFEFRSPQVSKTQYNPLSGQSMFGSLSGWFGFLTDGWGSVSALFFIERTFLFLRDRYFHR